MYFLSRCFGFSVEVFSFSLLIVLIAAPFSGALEQTALVLSDKATAAEDDGKVSVEDAVETSQRLTDDVFVPTGEWKVIKPGKF